MLLPGLGSSRSSLAGSLLATTLLMACGAPAAVPPPTVGGVARPATVEAAAASSPTPAPVRVRAASSAVSGVMAPLWAAQEAGLYTREGLEVEVLAFPSGNESVNAMVAGELDFVQTGAASVVGAALGGADTVVLTTPWRTIIAALMVRPEIAQPADLRDKAVGVSRRGTSIDSAARVALRHVGLEPDRDVAITQSGNMPNILAALEAGRIQGGVMSYPFATLARRVGMRELLDVASLGVPYAFTGATTRRGQIAERPDVVRRFVRAQVAAAALLYRDKAFALAAFRKHLQTDDEDVLEDTYEIYIRRYLQLTPLPDEASIQAVLDELASEIPRAREANPRDFFDDRFVRELDESGFIRAQT